MLILVLFGIENASNLCTRLVKLYVESAKYGVKDLKSYQIYPCHLCLLISPLSGTSEIKQTP